MKNAQTLSVARKVVGVLLALLMVITSALPMIAAIADDESGQYNLTDNPALGAGTSGEPTMDVTVTIGWAGAEPSDHSSRPTAVYLTMERSTNGTSWQTYTEETPFFVTAGALNEWSATFAVPSQDSAGRPYTYRVTESHDGLGRYMVPSEAQVTASGSSSEVIFTNTYNDSWDYHVQIYWDVTDDQGKISQDIHTTDRATQEITYHIAINTQKTYEACDDPFNPTTGIAVRVPAELFKDRDGISVLPSEISVGTEENYDPTYCFRYAVDIDTGDLIFYNWCALPSAYNIDMKVQYKIDPIMMEDCTLGELQAHSEGHYPYQPVGDDGLQDTGVITYLLDTGAEFTQFSKDDGYPLFAVPSALDVGDFDFENFRYMVYILRYSVDGNQPINSLQFTDKPRTADGENGKVIGIIRPAISSGVYGGVTTYSCNAAALSDPKGTSVAFTEDAQGAAHWSETIDLMAVKGGNYIEYGEYCYYIIVQYDPKEDGSGSIAEEMTYHNDEATGYIEVSDPQHENDVRGVNDLYDTDFETDEAYGVWAPERDPGGGDVGAFFAQKGMTSSTSALNRAGFTRLQYGQSYCYYATTSFLFNGAGLEDGTTYYADWYDDDVFVCGKYDDGSGTSEWHGYEKLGPDEFEINFSSSNVSIEVTAYDTNPVTGQHIIPTGEFRIQVKNSSGQWIDIDTFTLDSSGNITYKLASKVYSNKGYSGIRVISPDDLTGYLSIGTVVYYVINGDSPVVRHLIDDLHATDINVVNISTNDVYTKGADEDEYRIFNGTTLNGLPDYDRPFVEETGIADYPGERLPDGHIHAYRADMSTPAKYSQSSGQEKGVIQTEDHQENHSISHQWYVFDYESLTTDQLPRELLQDMEFSADSCTYYDLLPPGYHLDETRPIEAGGYNSSNKNTLISSDYPAVVTDYTVTPDYKGTGRDLLTLHVESQRDPHDNIKIFNNAYTYTGFAIRYWTTVSYFDVADDTVYNICEYQRGDRRKLANGFNDDRGYGSSTVSDRFMVDGIYPLQNMDGDGIGQPGSALYSNYGVHPTFVGNVQDGLYKFVRGNGGVWAYEDKTDENAVYYYEILMETGEHGTTEGVILYDVLEDAANTGGATGEADGWKGELQSVDTSQARSMGIYPVVYYTTQPVNYNNSHTISGHTVWDDALDERPEIWSTEMPADKSSITAVAVDMRWADEEQTEPFVFDGANFVNVVLAMKAPGDTPEEPYAYNRTAFDSTRTFEGSANSTTEFSISTRTMVELIDLQDFKIFKYYEETDENSVTTQKPHGGVTFELYTKSCDDTSAGHTHNYDTTRPGSAGSC